MKAADCTEARKDLYSQLKAFKKVLELRDPIYCGNKQHDAFGLLGSIFEFMRAELELLSTEDARDSEKKQLKGHGNKVGFEVYLLLLRKGPGRRQR